MRVSRTTINGSDTDIATLGHQPGWQMVSGREAWAMFDPSGIRETWNKKRISSGSGVRVAQAQVTSLAFSPDSRWLAAGEAAWFGI